MAISSGSTLQQADEVGGVATGSFSGTPTEASSYRPGASAPDIIVFSHVFRHGWSVDSLLIFVGTAPAGDYDFIVDAGGTTTTVTLPGGSSSKEFDLNDSVVGGDELRVTTELSSDPNLADIRCSFGIS